MVVILPFEEKVYLEAGVDVSFVGHPLLDIVRVKDERELPRSRYIRAGRDRLVGLLPGSRKSELSMLLPILLDAASILAKKIPGLHCLVPLAPTIPREQVAPFIERRDLPLTLVEGNTHEVMQMCEVLVVASGTATLEAAILGTPFVVVYKVNPLTYWLGKRLIRVRHVALANIVAGETVVPELLQKEARPEQIAAQVMAILGDTRRRTWMRQRLAEVRESLGKPGASNNAAAIVLALLGRGKSQRPIDCPAF
jgi:lipid-A-disaccharide synthase